MAAHASLFMKNRTKNSGHSYLRLSNFANREVSAITPHAATAAGLSISTDLTGNSFTNKTTADGLGDNVTTSVALGPDGKIWVGTSYGGIQYK